MQKKINAQKNKRGASKKWNKKKVNALSRVYSTGFEQQKILFAKMRRDFKRSAAAGRISLSSKVRVFIVTILLVNRKERNLGQRSFYGGRYFNKINK
jgi:hypothetical protein